MPTCCSLAQFFESLVASCSPPLRLLFAWRATVWLESMDAAGPAAVFRANGVTGRDLLGFKEASELVTELRMTPFASKKVLQLRDA